MKTLLAALLMVASAVPAAAATYTYNLVNATFVDGGTMTGSFEYDSVTGLGDFSFTTTAGGGFTARTFDNGNSALPYGPLAGYAYGFVGSDWFQLVPTSFSSGVGPTLVDGQTMDIDTAVYAGVFENGASRYFQPGAQIAPVPEPGEWAMIVAGLGLVGAAARRRCARAKNPGIDSRG